MKPKRKVSSNLGRTQHRNADRHYVEIKKRIGSHRKCPFYNGAKYPQFSPSTHDTLNPAFPNPQVPIEEFDFALKSSGKWGLQAYCKVCYKAYRDARISKSRATWITEKGRAMTENQIRAWHRKNVGPTSTCSVCRQPLPLEQFAISRSMEKGIHNVCKECQAATGSSVREQAWLADGNWDSWKESVKKMRRNRKVTCAGWPRSQAVGACKIYDDGKRMHADHKVPLRACGINDAKNFQPLCTPCNSKKSDQLDPRLSIATIRALIGRAYKKIPLVNDSIPTIERKLKSALMNKIVRLEQKSLYLEAIRRKKKEVNGQWVPEHAHKKGVEWLKRGAKRIEE